MLTTDENHTSNDLIAQKKMLKNTFDAINIIKNEKWFKIIAHGIEISTFDNEMQYLQIEIETYKNGVVLNRQSNWLTRDRAKKLHFSVILTFANEEMAKKTFQELNICNRDVAVRAGLSSITIHSSR